MKENDMNHDYDVENDILSFFLVNGFRYEFSEFLNKSIVIDYNKNKQPIGFEILDASEIFKTKKIFLKNIIGGEIDLKICEKEIILDMTLIVKIHNKSTPLPINLIGNNDIKIPTLETKVAIAST